MNKCKFIFLTIIVSTIICSCSENDSSRQKQFLLQAEAVLPDMPDSALSLLDSITEPHLLGEEDRMRYYVDVIEARHRRGKDISSDTAIYTSARYFENNGDTYQAARACLFSGCVAQKTKDKGRALELFLKAESFANRTTDKKLMATVQYMLGSIYFVDNIFSFSIDKLHSALNLYKQVPGTEKFQMNTCRLLGTNYAMPSVGKDSAFVYYDTALDIARQLNDTITLKELLTGIGLVYMENKEDFSTAKNYFLSVVSLSGDSASSNNYVNLARAYGGLGKADSVKYYMHLAEKELSREKDLYVYLSVNYYISEYKESIGQYREALEYYKQYVDKVADVGDETVAQMFMVVEKRYNFVQKEKEVAELEGRQNIYVFSIILSILLLIVAALLVRANRNKHIQERKKNEMLGRDVNNMLFLNRFYRKITDKSMSFEKDVESLSYNYSIRDKSPGYGAIQNLLKDVKKDTQSNLDSLTRSFLGEHGVDNDVLDIINTTDMMYLSLVICKYAPKDIASLLGTTPHALHMRKQRLMSKIQKSGLDEDKIKAYFS